ncbi:MAG: LPP20 family lipoprotein, partial [Candidatus Rokubacteria bacterium]|nr:LPP20 family lipoprotein [Candidatus Rokubacteria bacterium]
MARVAKRQIVGLILILVLVPSLGAAQLQVGPADKIDGGVNWTTQLVTATGRGVPPPNAVSAAQGRALAITAATVLARAALLENIKGVVIEGQTTVQNAMVSNSVVQQRVSGVIRGAAILNTRELSDGSVEVTVGIPAKGELAEIVIPSVPRPPAPVTPPAPAPVTPAPTAPPRPAPAVTYTGLVVDARGLSVRPAMAPKIVSE